VLCGSVFANTAHSFLLLMLKNLLFHHAFHFIFTLLALLICGILRETFTGKIPLRQVRRIASSAEKKLSGRRRIGGTFQGSRASPTSCAAKGTWGSPSSAIRGEGMMVGGAGKRMVLLGIAGQATELVLTAGTEESAREWAVAIRSARDRLHRRDMAEVKAQTQWAYVLRDFDPGQHVDDHPSLPSPQEAGAAGEGAGGGGSSHRSGSGSMLPLFCGTWVGVADYTEGQAWWYGANSDQREG